MLFKDEKDKIMQLIKRILYAEGDHLKLQDESVKYLKNSIYKIVSLFENAEIKSEKKTKSSLKKRAQKVNRKKQREEVNENTESEGEDSYQESSDSELDEYDKKRDGINHPEISDSSASENSEQENDENFRQLDLAKFYYVFENIIQRFYKLKKKAKEANKQLKLEEQNEQTKLEGDEF